ncbi:MAG: hypothetical protein Q9166_006268 [cf. Caloplaca sp. 2 TL-2023]
MDGHQQLRILCFGASITAGSYNFGLKHHPYASRLKDRLQKALPSHHITVDVDGLSGDLVIGGHYRSRLQPHFDSSAAKTYDWLIFQAGGNDLRWDEDPSAIFAEMKNLWTTALKGGAKVMALTVTDTEDQRARTKERYGQLNNMIKSYRSDNFFVANVCSKIPYAEMPSDQPKAVWDDGLHFKPLGYDMIGDAVANRMLEILQASFTPNFDPSYVDLKRPPFATPGNRLSLNYRVPGSTISVYMVIEPSHPIDRAAMGRTILTEQKKLRQRLDTQGDSWLAVQDDPYEIDDKRTGKCMIGMKSVHVGANDGRRLTYHGVLDVMQALLNVLYMKRREYEAVFQISNDTYLVGNGKIIVGNVLQQIASK